MTLINMMRSKKADCSTPFTRNSRAYGVTTTVTSQVSGHLGWDGAFGDDGNALHLISAYRGPTCPKLYLCS